MCTVFLLCLIDKIIMYAPRGKYIFFALIEFQCSSMDRVENQITCKKKIKKYFPYKLHKQLLSHGHITEI